MKLFDFLKQGKLKPTWRYAASGAIWRVFPTESGKLVGEERDLLLKHTSFFCLNQMTGEVLWEKLSLQEPWWIGVEAIHRDVIFFHRFATPDLPEHRSIIAVDLLSGAILWSNEELKFILSIEDTVYGSKESVEGQLLFELEYRSGALLRSWGNNQQIIKDAKALSVSRLEDQIEFPAPVNTLQEETLAATSIRSLITKGNLVGSIEAIEYGDVVIFNYHETTPQSTEEQLQVNNILKVAEKSTGGVVFSEVLNSGAATVAPESFFVQQGTLYYIKDRTVLTAVRMSVADSVS